MEFYAITEKGTNHAENEDFYMIEKKGDKYLFTIADGVGGLPDGAIASKKAITVLKNLFTQKNTSDLKKEIEQINQSILFEGEKRKSNMATTLVVCMLDKKTGKTTIAHVGDSRAYVINDKIWHTKDHSPVQELVEMGVLTEEDAFHHPERHRMSQAIGMKPFVDIRVNKKLLKDSILLLCSDGLSNYVRDLEIANIVRQNTPKFACKKLVKKARENGSTDDITIIIAHFNNETNHTHFKNAL